MKSVVGKAGMHVYGHDNKSTSFRRNAGVTLRAIKNFQCGPWNPLPSAYKKHPNRHPLHLVDFQLLRSLRTSCSLDDVLSPQKAKFLDALYMQGCSLTLVQHHTLQLPAIGRNGVPLLVNGSHNL